MARRKNAPGADVNLRVSQRLRIFQLNDVRMQKQIDFLVELDKLKTIYRRSYLSADSSRKENDAEHMWHISIMAILLKEHCPAQVDVNRVIRLLLVHDVVEVDAGDISVYLRKDDQELRAREHKAARRIFGLLPADQGQELLEAWYEFDNAKTSEALYARAVDRLMPLVLNFYTQGKTWQDVGVSYEQVISTNQRIIEPVSPELWAYAKSMIEECLAKGYLKKSG
jgi:putative hydrolase of HD superfamily